MRWTFCLAAAAALAATAATAQTEPAEDSGGDEVAPLEVPATATWNATIRDVFFSDEGSMTLRLEADIRAKWAGLSPEDQRNVRADCTATRSGSVGGAGAGGTAAEAPKAEPPPVSSENTGAAGSAVAAGEISLSHLVQICALVDEMSAPEATP